MRLKNAGFHSAASAAWRSFVTALLGIMLNLESLAEAQFSQILNAKNGAGPPSPLTPN
jgi:hypothetical protein